jgi:hypothetical protein
MAARSETYLLARSSSPHHSPNERYSRQALFGCGFAAMVVVCLQLD